MESNEAWQGPALPKEVWLAPARVHRKDVAELIFLLMILGIAVLAFLLLLTYSLCVMAEDEEDEEQAEWIRKLNDQSRDNEKP